MPENNLIFFDTNILVYAYDRGEPEKSKIAAHLIQETWEDHRAVTSFQVLQEFLVTTVHKIKTPLVLNQAVEICKNFCTWEPVATNQEIFFDACQIMAQNKLSYWDAAILAQAMWASCRYLYSEDLQNGFELKGLKVINPFHGSMR